jgi:glutaredoxin
MEARQCTEHGLIAGADGRCVICRRGETPEVKQTSGDLPVVGMLVGVGALLALGVVVTVLRERPGSDPVATTNQEVLNPEARGGDGSTPADPAATQPGAGTPSKPRRSNLDEELPTSPAPSASASEGSQELTPEQIRALRRKVPIKMFVRKDCSLCDRARLWIRQQGMPLTELDVDASPTDKVLLQSINPEASVPTFELGGKVLIGYERIVLEQTVDEIARPAKPASGDPAAREPAPR